MILASFHISADFLYPFLRLLQLNSRVMGIDDELFQLLFIIVIFPSTNVVFAFSDIYVPLPSAFQ